MPIISIRSTARSTLRSPQLCMQSPDMSRYLAETTTQTEYGYHCRVRIGQGTGSAGRPERADLRRREETVADATPFEPTGSPARMPEAAPSVGQRKAARLQPARRHFVPSVCTQTIGNRGSLPSLPGAISEGAAGAMGKFGMTRSSSRQGCGRCRQFYRGTAPSIWHTHPSHGSAIATRGYAESFSVKRLWGMASWSGQSPRHLPTTRPRNPDDQPNSERLAALNWRSRSTPGR